MDMATVSTSRPLVAGLGLRATASVDSLHALWLQACAWFIQQPGWPSSTSPFCTTVAVLTHKAQHPALLAWQAQLPFATRLVAVPPERLAAQAVHTQSPRLLALYGTGSVAEAAALAAAGPGARLWLPRLVAPDGCATLALACAAPPFDFVSGGAMASPLEE